VSGGAMNDDENLICGYYALKSSRSYADFCSIREARPPFDKAARFVRVHWADAPQWVRDLMVKLEAAR
jgi:hypothetical protein